MYNNRLIYKEIYSYNNIHLYCGKHMGYKTNAIYELIEDIISNTSDLITIFNCSGNTFIDNIIRYKDKSRIMILNNQKFEEFMKVSSKYIEIKNHIIIETYLTNNNLPVDIRLRKAVDDIEKMKSDDTDVYAFIQLPEDSKSYPYIYRYNEIKDTSENNMDKFNTSINDGTVMRNKDILM